MGSSGKPTKSNARFVTVETETLRNQLNHLYAAMRECTKGGPSPSLFEYLWDIKELALKEGRPTVQVSKDWLEKIEQECLGSSQGKAGRAV